MLDLAPPLWGLFVTAMYAALRLSDAVRAQERIAKALERLSPAGLKSFMEVGPG